MGLPQFLLTFFASAVTVSGLSLVWPKLTDKPRPEPLSRVREIVMQTPFGANAANILGVTDEATAEPINVSSAAASIAGSVTSTVTQRVQQAIGQQFVTQLVRQYDRLPDEQKQQVRDAICQPKESIGEGAQEH